MAARAGYCAECGDDVWLKDGGGCIQNHDPASVQDSRLVPLPPELDRFNWGAFFFPVLWPLVKGPINWAGIIFGVGFLTNILYELMPSDWWPLALVLGVGEFALGVWYARNANRLLWEHRPWTVDVGKLLNSQRKWGLTGLILSVGGLLVLVVVSLTLIPPG